MKFKSMLLVICLLLAFTVYPLSAENSSNMDNGGKKYETEIDKHKMTMWMPDNVKVIKGVFVNINCGGGDTTDINKQPHWKEAAITNSFAYLGTYNFGCAAAKAEGKILLDGLVKFAGLSGHKELNNAPFVLYGFSNGAMYSFDFNTWMPERVIAFVANKGTFYQTQKPKDSALKTPALLIAGEGEHKANTTLIHRLISLNRPRGAKWACLVEQGMEHREGTVLNIALPFIQQCIQLRYPQGASPLDGPVKLKDIPEKSGWLADQSTFKSGITKIYSYDQYKGDKSGACWLPNQYCANIYRSYATLPSATSYVEMQQKTAKPGDDIEIFVRVPLLKKDSKISIYNGDKKLGEIENGKTLSFKAPKAGFYGIIAVWENTRKETRTSSIELLKVVQ